jgi:hypothetical protein
MRSSQVPRIATWLYKHLGPPNAELAGDLFEECRSGRSPAWYWRQVLMAIAVHVHSEIRAHRFLAAKAAISGLTLLYLLHAVSGRSNGAWKIFFALNRPVARAEPDLYRAMFSWIIFLEIFVVFAAAAWLAGRVNRRYSRGLLFVLLTSWTLWFWWSTSSYWLMLVADSIRPDRFRPYLGTFLARYLVAAAELWIGGWPSVFPVHEAEVVQRRK